MGTYHGAHLPLTNPFEYGDGCLVLEDKDKDVVLQLIEIMGTIEILDQLATHVNLVDLINDAFISIRTITMEVPTL